MTARRVSTGLVNQLALVLVTLAVVLVGASSNCDVVIPRTTDAGAQLNAALAKCDSPDEWVICFGAGVSSGFSPNGTVLATPTGANLTLTMSAQSRLTERPTFNFEGGQGFIIGSGFTTLFNVNIENGVSQGDGGCVNVVGGMFAASSVSLSQCTSEEGNGGAVALSTNAYWSLSSISIRSCTAKMGLGGGLYVQVTTSPIVSLLATDDLECSYNVAKAGGCVALIGSPSHPVEYIFDIRATNNTAIGGDGGGIFVSTSPSWSSSSSSSGSSSGSGSDGNGSSSGSGSFSGSISSPTLLTVSLPGHSLIESNTATGSGGGVALLRVNGLMKASLVSNVAGENGGGLYLVASNSTVMGQVGYNTAQSGGGLYAVSGGKLSLDELTLANNNATRGSGGGAFVSGVPVNGFSLGVYQNVASHNGGGLYVEGNSEPMVLLEGGFGSNNATLKGGSLYLSGGAGAVLTRGVFSGSLASEGSCMAVVNGGSVFLKDSLVELAVGGSAIDVSGPMTSLAVSHSMIAGNEGSGLNCSQGAAIDLGNIKNLLCSNSGPDNLECDSSCSGCSSYSPPGGVTTCAAQCSVDEHLCIPVGGTLYFPPCPVCQAYSSTSSFTPTHNTYPSSYTYPPVKK